ncbi:MAG: hypothetical protein ACK5XN_31220, partial [Bacteroidota bacterium]
MLPFWGVLEVLNVTFPDYPLAASIVALLFGELVKWHCYSQVLSRFSPISVDRVLGWVVLGYELGTIGAAFSLSLNPWMIKIFEIVALSMVYWPAFMRSEGDEYVSPAITTVEKAPEGVLPSLVALGLVAGFLKVSADTGFKFALKLEAANIEQEVAKFYLLSASFTLALGIIRRMRWMTPRMGCPQASFTGFAICQGIFAGALLFGNLYALVAAAALQRSVDKIFYQPTMQLLASGFNPSVQEFMRRWHVKSFLAYGSLLGLAAFSMHKILSNPKHIVVAMGVLHAAAAVGIAVAAGIFVKRVVEKLDEETKRAGALGGSRPMAMLALLSPRHFLVHALVLSERRGGMKGLPQELLTGLTADAGGEVTESFYLAYPQLNDQHQMALVRLAVFLDRKADRSFLIAVASEEIPSSIRARRLAALHIVKTHGRQY